MEERNASLADIHLHFYGSIPAEDFLDYVVRRDVDWTAFEANYRDAFGELSRVGEVIERHRNGDPSASADFKRLYVLGDRDAGSFHCFQAKFSLLDAGSVLGEYLTDKSLLPYLLDEWRYFLQRTVHSQRRAGIGYAEQRLLLGANFQQDHARQAFMMVLQAYSELEATGFTGRLAVSLPRGDPWPRRELVQELALGPYGYWVTGVDFCNVEEGNPPWDQDALFREGGHNREIIASCTTSRKGDLQRTARKPRADSERTSN